jgi:hypothetical protein
MKEEIKKVIEAALEKKGHAKTDENIMDFLLYSAKEVYCEVTDSRRWWDEVFRVVDVDGTKIGFDWANTTGDDSARDKGWEFDPESVCFVEEETVTKTIYKPKA